ncbi:guanidinobutyrase-like isoform X2 [Tubulanus polymorphus]|uniref:guanidinobutyrase-like isoform X2 n=1 Tax=Tubulanus polymorphus TaxID=672921 RepID=UPI003DA62CA0
MTSLVRLVMRAASSASRLSSTSSISSTRQFSASVASQKELNRPPTGNEVYRAGGIATMARLPLQSTAEGLDACFVGIPLDCGASNRAGTRHGPRAIRAESSMVRLVNNATGASPFESLQVADIGDITVNPYNLPKCCDIIRDAYEKILNVGCRPLGIGGDHTVTYPILQAMKDKFGPVALVHIDAHNDTQPSIMGEAVCHSTPVYRAVDEKLIDGAKVFQIGLRAWGNVFDEDAWARKQGFHVYPAQDLWHKSLTPLMKEIRAKIGPDTPTYISFDIDGLDPAYAPGTGTPEIGGLTTIQALEILRGCRGLNIVGGDVVEVSPPYDTSGNTALTAAYLLMEMLCVFPGVKYYDQPREW